MPKQLRLFHYYIFLSCLILVIFGDYVAAQDTEETPEVTPAVFHDLPDLEGREITVLVENNYPPFNFIDSETEEGVGWDYDTIHELCERLNCEVVFVEFEWEDMLDAIADEEYDLAADGITITEERAKLVEFSIPYMQLAQVILARAGEDRFADVESLVDAETILVGTRPDTTNFNLAVELIGEDRISSYESFDLAIEALLEGDVDAVMIDDVAGQRYIRDNDGLLQVMGVPLTSEELGFVFPLDSDLIEPFNEALVTMQDDGTLDKLFIYWFIEYDTAILDVTDD
jgi:polar amino acid transport system substrate-binding protein